MQWLTRLAVVCSTFFIASMATAVPPSSGELRMAETATSDQAILAPAGITWQQAREAALLRDGDLVSITSAAENNFVFSLVDSAEFWHQSSVGFNIGPWIGSFQTEATGPHKWTSGETFSFTNWATGYPNDSVGLDNERVAFYAQTYPARTSQWYEAYDNSLIGGYVVELAPANAAPMRCGIMGCAPSSPFGLLATPLVLLAWSWSARRRWRRSSQKRYQSGAIAPAPGRMMPQQRRSSMKNLTRVVAACLAGALVMPAMGAPVEWRKADGGNGHIYDPIPVPGGITWQDGA